MNQSNKLNDNDPLPIADHNSELETFSRRALETVLPVSRFRFRDERTEDAGVDGSIELLSNGRSTNFRAQIQLKGTETSVFNQDGSFSLSIKTSNLNYLLNGSSTLYILYILPKKEIRFVWAHDEQSRLERTNPTWKQQETVTISFREILNSQTLEEVFQRVMREGKMYRKSLETIDRTSSNERVVISYDPTNLSMIDSDEAKNFFLSQIS